MKNGNKSTSNIVQDTKAAGISNAFNQTSCNTTASPRSFTIKSQPLRLPYRISILLPLVFLLTDFKSYLGRIRVLFFYRLKRLNESLFLFLPIRDTFLRHQLAHKVNIQNSRAFWIKPTCISPSLENGDSHLHDSSETKTVHVELLLLIKEIPRTKEVLNGRQLYLLRKLNTTVLSAKYLHRTQCGLPVSATPPSTFSF